MAIEIVNAPRWITGLLRLLRLGSNVPGVLVPTRAVFAQAVHERDVGEEEVESWVVKVLSVLDLGDVTWLAYILLGELDGDSPGGLDLRILAIRLPVKVSWLDGYGILGTTALLVEDGPEIYGIIACVDDLDAARGVASGIEVVFGRDGGGQECGSDAGCEGEELHCDGTVLCCMIYEVAIQIYELVKARRRNE